MKNTIFFLGIFLLLANSVKANDELVVVTKANRNKKEVVVMYKKIDGAVKLFYEPANIASSIEQNIYYIGFNKEVEEINSRNYKQLIKKYLPEVKDLHQRLGKRGFRYENIPSMILYYNKLITGNIAPFTKSEITRLGIQ